MQEYAHSHGYELAEQFFRAATPVQLMSDDVFVRSNTHRRKGFWIVIWNPRFRDLVTRRLASESHAILSLHTATRLADQGSKGASACGVRHFHIAAEDGASYRLSLCRQK
jgi:hypothetical protein